jgi:hypothetical protein
MKGVDFMKKIIINVAIELLLTIVAIVCWMASYGFCNGTVIGSAIAALLITVAAACVFILGYRINK